MHPMRRRPIPREQKRMTPLPIRIRNRAANRQIRILKIRPKRIRQIQPGPLRLPSGPMMTKTLKNIRLLSHSA